MVADAYYFDEGTLTVTEESGSTEVAVAGIQGITIEPEYGTLERLYTADSTQIESQKQAEAAVNVEIDYSKFDIDAAKQWLGGSGSSATSLTDTSDPTKFTVKVVSTSADEGIERTAEVTGVTFESWPLVDGSQGEFEEYNLSGTGETVSQLADTSA